MNFMDYVENTVGVTTENGAKVYKSTKNALVDLNYMVGSMRSAYINNDEHKLKEFFNKFLDAFEENPYYTTLWMFYLRDPRNGLGERSLFRYVFGRFILGQLGNYKSYKPLMKCIINHGRFDDIIIIGLSSEQIDTIELIDEVLNKDLENMKNGDSISLLAKWMPSINTSSKESRSMAREICKHSKVFNNDYSLYAKTLKKMRAYLKVVETKMSQNKWHEIDYSIVPSKANILYGKAFSRHDQERREKFINDVIDGKSKINTNTLFPYEVVHMYNRYDINFDANKRNYVNAIWNNLPEPKETLKNSVVVRDGSGSMTIQVSGSTTAMDIGDAITLYIAKHSDGCFHNKFITFSANSEVVTVDPNDLCKSIDILRRYDAYDTNILSAFEIILETAKENNLNQEDIPEKIIIVSDMEFNDVLRMTDIDDTGWGRNIRNPSYTTKEKLFKYIEKMYKEEGYKLPHLVFWNVNNRTGGVPMIENEKGLTLMSGFSSKAFNMLLSDKIDPWDVLKDTLDDSVFEDVVEVIKTAESKD